MTINKFHAVHYYDYSILILYIAFMLFFMQIYDAFLSESTIIYISKSCIFIFTTFSPILFTLKLLPSVFNNRKVKQNNNKTRHLINNPHPQFPFNPFVNKPHLLFLYNDNTLLSNSLKRQPSKIDRC